MEKSFKSKKNITALITAGVIFLGVFFGQEIFVEKNIQPYIPKIVDQIFSEEPDEEGFRDKSFYEVVRIADGDTFTIKKDNENITLRLLGIDTPEKSGPFTDEACYGKEATEIITNLLEGHTVTYKVDKTSGERDRYGRVLAYVYTDEEVFINAELLKVGAARIYTKNIRHAEYEFLQSIEDKARREKKGLWGECEGSLYQ